ncbi:preprotein translocase subunit YajC [Luteococcus sediminum]
MPTPMLASGMTTILLLLVGMLVFTFLLQRPLKKQAEAQARLRDSLGQGQRVLLTSGIFATVNHVGTEQLIVEIAPGVEVSCTKQAVVKTVTPDEEEFEFADELPAETGTEVEPLESTAAPADPTPRTN